MIERDYMSNWNLTTKCIPKYIPELFSYYCKLKFQVIMVSFSPTQN